MLLFKTNEWVLWGGISPTNTLFLWSYSVFMGPTLALEIGSLAENSVGPPENFPTASHTEAEVLQGMRKIATNCGGYGTNSKSIFACIGIFSKNNFTYLCICRYQQLFWWHSMCLENCTGLGTRVFLSHIHPQPPYTRTIHTRTHIFSIKLCCNSVRSTCLTLTMLLFTMATIHLHLSLVTTPETLFLQ